MGQPDFVLGANVGGLKMLELMAEDLRGHGLTGCLPDPPRGVEREFAGGIGAKKVDVSWSTEEAGLLLAISVQRL